MAKKLIVLFLIGTLLLAVGCGKQDFQELASSAQTVSSEPAPSSEPDPGPTLLPNPLTGVKELAEDRLNQRPVAIMINNVKVAQGVQCGLNSADLIFECLVEGGVTRLMAVFYDPSQVKQIGSIRSARYTYVQLVQGLDALYVHAGSDPVYTRPYMRNIGLDDYDMGRYGDGSFRVDNGLAWEHRLFTNGEILTADFEKHNFRTTRQTPMEPIFTFADEENALALTDGCAAITYEMSGAYTTTFVYDAQSGRYLRQPGGVQHIDNNTGEPTGVDNLFVLYADSPLFPDGLHLQTVLTNGDGLYCHGGKMQKITWYKGTADAPLQVFDTDGKPLVVAPGRSWIAFPRNSSKDDTVVQDAA